jgi:hypothetical protein
MATRRVRKEKSVPLPPLLVRVIHAARHAPYDPVDRDGHDAAIRELGCWALVRVPSEGVLAPDDSHAYQAIEIVAREHLAMKEARAAVKKALSAIEPFATRDAVESAYNQLQSANDNAYYYAGPACGITLADMATLRFDSQRHAAWFEPGAEEP